MFSNNNTNNLFGTQVTTTTQKSLFGNDNTGSFLNNQQGIGGLFENTNPTTGGGLFSNSNQQNNSLFSNNNNNPMSNPFSNINTTNYFENNKNTNNLFNTQSNSNSLFSNTITNNNQTLFQNNNNNIKDNTIGLFFNGANVHDKKDDFNFMSITTLPEFSYASNEELRLADYEKKQTGNIMKFKIENTSNNKLITQNNPNSNNFNISLKNNLNENKSGGLFSTFGTNSTSIFGNNNTTQTGGIFGNNQTTQGNSIFGNTNNNNQVGGLFGNTNNNNQLGGLFANTNNNQGTIGNITNSNQNGGLFGNNATNNHGTGQENSLFGNKTSNNIQSGGLFGKFSFGNNNNKSEGLFGNITNNAQGNTLFGNNTNTTGGGLFGNNNANATSNGGLFGKTNTQNNLFGNNLNNNQTGGLLGNNNTNQSGNMFENNNTKFGNMFGNNNNNFGGGLLGNFKNNNSNQDSSLFGDNKDKNGGIFGNTNNNTQLNNLFNNDNANNNTKIDGLFGNSKNNIGSFLNNNNTNTNSLFSKNNIGNSFLGNNITNTGGIFDKTQINEPNKNTENNLFGNNTPSFFNNKTNNTNTTFGNANNNTNIGGLFWQTNNPIFNDKNANTNQNTILNNANNNQTLSFLGNNNNNQQLSNNMSNNQDTTLFNEISYEDIVNPMNYINNQKSLKLSPEDQVLSKSIIDAIQKQKSVEEFLEDLDKKYNNNENIDNENTDILDYYGTYLSPTNNYENNQMPLKINLNIKKNNDISQKSYTNMKYRNLNNEKNNKVSSYNKMQLNKSILKINEIYDEYERYKNIFMRNNENIQLNNTQFEGLNQNKVKKKNLISNDSNNDNVNNKSTSFININEMIGKDEGLYQRNLIELNRLSNYCILKNNKENEDGNEIIIKNFKNEKDNKTKNNNKMLDIIIKYSLPNEEYNNKNNSKIHLDNVNQSIKIKTLKEEIKERLYNELELKNLDKKYSIEKISLLIPGMFLEDNKKLIDYNLDENDFNIQAYIIYNSISTQNKNELQIHKNKNSKSSREINMNREININKDELVPFDLLPKLAKEGYKCSPSIMELSRKTAEELRNIENFKIYNKYGEVEFKEPVNLLGLNLDDQVTIEKNIIDTGDKLDYWAIYKLFNFKTAENGLKKHKINLEKCGGNFLYYKNNEIAWEYNGKKEEVEKN